MMREVRRVLRPGGTFLQLSFQQPHFRKKYLAFLDAPVSVTSIDVGLGYFLFAAKVAKVKELVQAAEACADNDCIMRGFNHLPMCSESGDDFARQFSEVCTQIPLEKPVLRYLGVARNRIGKSGVEHLCRAVNPGRSAHRLANVRKVEAFCNEPSIAWFHDFFVAMMQGLPQLQVVDLGGMKIGDRAAAAIVKALNDAPQDRILREMHLDYTGLSPDSLPDLIRIIERLKLNCIFLEGNELKDKDLKKISQLCRRNRAFWPVEAPDIAPTVRKVRSISLPLLMPSSLADRIANIAIRKFLSLVPEQLVRAARGQLVVAAFVVHDESRDDLKVLSIATGTSFVSNTGLGFEMAELVPDSHAEVLARRALLAACYSGLVFSSLQKVYLYTSTAPCGYQKSGCLLGKDRKPLDERRSDQRKSCLLKIRRWKENFSGKHFFAVPFAGVVVSRKYKSWCQKEGYLQSSVSFESLLAGFGAAQTSEKGDSDASWYWFEQEGIACSEFLDGRTGRRLDGRLSCIARCKLHGKCKTAKTHKDDDNL